MLLHEKLLNDKYILFFGRRACLGFKITSLDFRNNNISPTIFFSDNKKYKEKDTLIISNCILRLSALAKHKSKLAVSLCEILENTKTKSTYQK